VAKRVSTISRSRFDDLSLLLLADRLRLLRPRHLRVRDAPDVRQAVAVPGHLLLEPRQRPEVGPVLPDRVGLQERRLEAEELLHPLGGELVDGLDALVVAVGEEAPTEEVVARVPEGRLLPVQVVLDERLTGLTDGRGGAGPQRPTLGDDGRRIGIAALDHRAEMRWDLGHKSRPRTYKVRFVGAIPHTTGQPEGRVRPDQRVVRSP
jgi:hypothetical protein